ncbi:MAG: FtsH protease activity modulator HflK [Candidatus Methylopumilus sp.]|jgi:membrane protease subunit HflK|nr:FtsH protease activity modulator HflK [Candidatus Methylopumilus sp.]NBW60360.1 FtsH protease activity modulator HflK [Methylophilaceae bacterium]
MANDSGWGKRNPEGPPDLDEALRAFGQKIRALFGGSAPKDNQPNNQVPVMPVIGLILFVWVATGFYIVDQGSRGVVLRFGKHVETTMPGPRWHMPYPIESVSIVNMEQVRTVEVGYRSSDVNSGRSKELRESLMLTDDENIIDLQIAVQFNLKNVEDTLFNNRSAEESVRSIAETAIREVVGQSKLDFVLYEGREEVAVNTKKLMQSILDRYKTGINVVSVTMQNAQPPEQVQAAFEDAVKAKQDLERQKNEGQAYANDVIPKARGTASRLAQEAAGYKTRVINEAQGNASRFNQILAQYQRAPEVTRQRLYIEAQEQILSSVSKVLVDQKAGNQLLYLPLDKLLSASDSNKTNNPEVNSTVAPTTDGASDKSRSRDASRGRERE